MASTTNKPPVSQASNGRPPQQRRQGSHTRQRSISNSDGTQPASQQHRRRASRGRNEGGGYSSLSVSLSADPSPEFEAMKSESRTPPAKRGLAQSGSNSGTLASTIARRESSLSRKQSDSLAANFGGRKASGTLIANLSRKHTGSLVQGMMAAGLARKNSTSMTAALSRKESTAGPQFALMGLKTAAKAKADVDAAAAAAAKAREEEATLKAQQAAPRRPSILSPNARRAAEANSRKRFPEKTTAVKTSTSGQQSGKKKRKKKIVSRVMAPLERVQTMDEIAKKAPDMLFAFENDVLHERAEVAKAAKGSASAAAQVKKSQPYHKQGDHYFDTHHMRIQRGRLRDHPDVVLELKRFWKFISQEPDASFMLKSNYIEMHICINKGLRQDFEAQQLHDDLRNLAIWDWKHDIENAKKRQRQLEKQHRGSPPSNYYIDDNCMSREAFYDGVFELVDLWTQTVIPDEYASFLKQLRFRISDSFQDAMDEARKRGDGDGSGLKRSPTSRSCAGRGCNGMSDDEMDGTGPRGKGKNGKNGKNGQNSGNGTVGMVSKTIGKMVGKGGKGRGRSGKDGRGLAGMRRVAQLGAPGADGRPFNFRSTATFWSRKPLKMKTVDNVALCSICQQTVQGDLHMCPHSQPDEAPEIALVPKRKIVRPKTARLHPEHMFAPVPVDTSNFVHESDEEKETEWELNHLHDAHDGGVPLHGTQRPMTAHPLSRHSASASQRRSLPGNKQRPATAMPLGHARRNSRGRGFNHHASTNIRHVRPSTGDPLRRRSGNRGSGQAGSRPGTSNGRHRPGTGGSASTSNLRPQSAIGRSGQDGASLESMLSLRVAGSGENQQKNRHAHRRNGHNNNGHFNSNGIAGEPVQLSPRSSSAQGAHRQGGQKEGGRRLVLSPAGEVEVGEEDEVDPSDAPMPDAVAYALAREELLKNGMELEVVDNQRNWLRCLLVAASEQTNVTVKLVEHDWTWDQVPDTHVRLVGAQTSLNEHLNLRRRRIQFQHNAEIRQRHPGKFVDEEDDSDSARESKVGRPHSLLQRERLDRRPHTARAPMSKPLGRPMSSAGRQTSRGRPHTARRHTERPWGQSTSPRSSQMVFRPKRRGMEF